jgi:hypothetical protein
MTSLYSSFNFFLWQLIKILQTLNIDKVIKDFYVIRPSDEQIDAIKGLKEYVPNLSKELESRIKVLSPAKKTMANPSKYFLRLRLSWLKK